MSEFASPLDPGEWYGRLQRSYMDTASESVLDELTDVGRLLAVTGIPVESVLEVHGVALAEVLAHADGRLRDGLVQMATTCLFQVMVAWRMAAEGLADDPDGAVAGLVTPPVFLPFGADGALSGDPGVHTLDEKLTALGVAARRDEVAEAVRGRRLMAFDVHPVGVAGQVLRAVLCPFHDGSGVLCIHDVSARRAAAALFQRHKLASLGQLAGGIAHEINNLLQPILSAAQFMAEDHADDPALMENVSIVLDSVRLAASVVRDVLAFARRGASDLVPMDLAEAVEREMGVLRRTLPAAARVTVDLQAAPVVRGNGGELAQVLRNLVGNAVEATQGRGRVALSVASVVVDAAQSARLLLPVGPYARLSVADDGPGIAPDAARRVFEPFFTTKEVGKGTGLGLAIVHGIVRGWGGTIVLRDHAEAGAVFDVYLPLSELAVRQAAAAAKAGDDGRGFSVAVVDDDAPVRQVIVRMLERAGYGVRDFASAEEALAEGAADADLVLTDWMMPGLDGFAFVKEMRRRRPHLPLVMVTGGGDAELEDELRQRARQTGIADVLFKPVSSQQLLNAARRCLEGTAPRGREEDMP